MPGPAKRSEASSSRRPHRRLENALRADGHERIAGVDEVGRGGLFGPVVAAAVILDANRAIRGLNDSKQLDAATGERLSRRIHERAVAVSVAAVDSAGIDRLNIYQAARRAMRQAVLGLDPSADAVLVDAMRLDLDVPQRSVIGGDAISRSIAAASIVAKVARDGWVCQWNEVYPDYQLGSNKGYASPAHLWALERLGPTPLHRLSFAPVAASARFAVRVVEFDPQMTLPLSPAPRSPAIRSSGGRTASDAG